MPVVVNSNATATASSFNLTRANDALRKSLERLSTGKRINSAADDAGGLSVAYKLSSKMNRTSAIIQNSQNALSYLQMQDSSLSAAGKIVDRMAELRTMAQDITKNTGDIENYSKEFMELQGQLNQIQKEKFNGISLFSTGSGTGSGILNQSTSGGTYIDGEGNSLNYDTFSRTLQTHDSGSSSDGSVSINVINFQFMLSIGGTASNPTGNSFNLGNIGDTKGTGDEFTGDYINDIKEVSVGAFIDIIARIADMRAENGAEQNRVMQRIDLLQSNLTNIEAAHGRIMDADIALESTRFARHNILVQASASMTAQANQLSSVALSLIG
jgi:flagellin